MIIYLNILELSIAQTPPQSSQLITTQVSGKAVFGIQGRTSATTDLTNPNVAIGRDGIPETNDPASSIGFADAFQFEINTQFPDRSRLVIEFEGGNGITNASSDSPFSLNNSFTKLGYIDNTNNRVNITNLAYRWQATDL